MPGRHHRDLRRLNLWGEVEPEFKEADNAEDEDGQEQHGCGRRTFNAEFW